MERAEIVEAATNTTDSGSAIATPSWRACEVLTLGFGAILLLARLGTRALWASEFRWAEIAREMILTHNYFWPTIDGHVYYDKPLGSYWLVVASTYLTGRMNEAAARLPSAMAGILAIALLMSLTRRLFGTRTAVMAGIILMTSFSFVFFSRSADADIETIAGELAVLLIYWSNQERAGWWIFAFWILMAITSLTKGLLGFVLPLIVIGTYVNLRDGWTELRRGILIGSIGERLGGLIKRNDWLFNRYTPIAILTAGLLYYWPFAISHAETGSAKGLYMVYRENVERYFAPFDHVGPIYMYTYVIFALIAPWSVFLPAAVANFRFSESETQMQARARRFVLCFFWTTFVFFTLSGSRRSYYLLPILPAGAIFVSKLFDGSMRSHDRFVRILFKAAFAILCFGVLISAIALLPPALLLPSPYSMLPNLPDQGIFVLYLLVSIGVCAYAVWSMKPGKVFIATAVAAWSFLFYFFVFAMPAGDAWRGEKPFALQVRALIDGESAELAFYKVGGPAYYLDLPTPVPSYNTQYQLTSAVDAGHTRWVILRRLDVNSLKLPATEAAHEALFPWDSRQHRLNSMVLLHVSPPKLSDTISLPIKREVK